MVKELLEKRDGLFEIAALLYGDSFITNQAFWGSPTERHLQELYEELHNLGYRFPEPSSEQVEQAKKIAKDLDLGLEFDN